jgi:hypothetical protein
MASLPRPLLALLILVVAFFAAWTLVLKPHGATDSSAPPQPAPAAPRTAGQAPTPGAGAQASAASGQAAVHTDRHETRAPVAPAPATKGHAAARAAKTKGHPVHRAAHPKFTEPATPRGRAQALQHALAADKVVAVLFYNPAGADDFADYQALTNIPAYAGRVVRLAVPITEIARYAAVTTQVPVTGSPTLVVIDGKHRAQTLVGFADDLAYDQLVAGALAAR